MSRRRSNGDGTLPRPTNDNDLAGERELTTELLFPQSLPIFQVEVEVFAALLDHWPVANDDEKT